MPAITKGNLPQWMVNSAPYDIFALANPVALPANIQAVLKPGEQALYDSLPFINSTDDVVKNMVRDRLVNALATNEKKKFWQSFLQLRDIAKEYPQAAEVFKKYTSFLGE